MPVTKYFTVNGRMIGESTGGTRTDYITDALGSIVATVKESGEIQNTYRYKPYGCLLAKTGTGADPKFLWTGNTGSRVTGRTFAEQYNQARHYGSTQASWTTVDPLWPAESTYGYTAANPVNYVDPTGWYPSSCNKPRTNDCRPISRESECCAVKSITCMSALSKAQFNMTLTRSSSQIYGLFVINVVYLIQYERQSIYSFCVPFELQSTSLKVRATSGLAGHQKPSDIYTKGKGPIPSSKSILPKKWSIKTACLPANQTGFIQGSEAYKFMIAPENVWDGEGDTRKRGEFRVHPDGNRTGSAGCIVPDTAQNAKKVRSCIYWASAYGCSSIPLQVDYP